MANILNTYDIHVGSDEVKLRLTWRGQMNLKKKYNAEALGVIFDAIADIEKAVNVLTEALNYNGNENPYKKGEDLYDALVDDGMTGYDGIAKIMAGIAVSSGIIAQDKADAIVNYMVKAMNANFDALAREELEAEIEADSKNA